MDKNSFTEPPLKGIKVLELGSLIAGPYAGSLLAQFGADVIKIEPPGKGDPLRRWRQLHKDTSLWWRVQSRNKRSIALDLRQPEGQEIARELALQSDIVIENFRPGVLERWGLGWETLHALNPRLIMVRVSGYGQDGPYHRRPGFAAIAECMGGLRYGTGYPDRPPVRAGVSLGDTLASLYGTIGALLAMHHLRQEGGQGQMIDVALYESVFAIMESLIPDYQLNGHQRERTGASLPGIAPSNTYPTGDGKWVVIAANSDAIFIRLMQAMSRPDLANDPRLSDNAGRVEHSAMLDQTIGDWTGARSLEEVLSVLDQAEVPSGSIYTAADILDDPHYQARGMLEKHTLEDGQELTIPGIVPKLSRSPGATQWLGPELGEHTDSILQELGMSPERRQALREQGIVE
ncbi:CoA transferase [Alcaligenes sp. 1735tsa3]|uniref:CaiB/BaiF CoA transferase family protein n=1 Tax=Alcaligenes sp. 1735tsa3 TaxID=2953809 RepID=UPI00075B492A|nr:CaiB/BaiF CoA-transferase family protein [Alcaligenes sp. 1735tsa3]KVX06229.1 carnitine dehydratase [Alcaligenes faecalis]USY25625.1 CoA transferase [Alcaligenes sp. 1735tsa3]